MIRVGLTGGIGSGKTTVARIFEALRIPIYYADSRGKFLLENDVDLKESVVETFGEEILNEEGAIERSKLAEIVFNDPDKLERLNSLVHPAVGRDYRAWCESTSEGHPYTIKEAAILMETGLYREMDVNIIVTAPEELRVKRVMERDGADESQVRSRMDKQWPEGDKIPLADYIVVNDGEHSLIEQVLALHALLSQE